MDTTEPAQKSPQTASRRIFSYIFLVAACLAAGALIAAFRLPGAWLIGPLFLAAAIAIRGGPRLKLPRRGIVCIQSIIGVSLAGSFLPSSLPALAHHWLPVLVLVLSMQCLTIINALYFVHSCGLNPSTALLGTLPGGAGEMSAMSENFGADPRLVSVMQYTRLLVIILFLSVGTSIIVHTGGARGLHLNTAPPLSAGSHLALAPLSSSTGLSILDSAVHVAPVGPLPWIVVVLPVVISGIGALAAVQLRIPAGTLLIPLSLSVWTASCGYPAVYPKVVLMATYALLGMQIGSQFDCEVLERMKGLLLPLLGTSFFLAIGSIVIGVLFARLIGLDGASAYLASTPGGLDSVAVVANEIKADSAVVLSVHFTRLLLVLISGPQLVKAFSRLHGWSMGSDATD